MPISKLAISQISVGCTTNAQATPKPHTQPMNGRQPATNTLVFPASIWLIFVYAALVVVTADSRLFSKCSLARARSLGLGIKSSALSIAGPINGFKNPSIAIYQPLTTVMRVSRLRLTSIRHKTNAISCLSCFESMHPI